MDNFEQFRQLMSGINFDATIVIGVIVIIATFIIECVLLNKSYINIKSSKKKKYRYLSKKTSTAYIKFVLSS